MRLDLLYCQAHVPCLNKSQIPVNKKEEERRNLDWDCHGHIEGQITKLSVCYTAIFIHCKNIKYACIFVQSWKSLDISLFFTSGIYSNWISWGFWSSRNECKKQFFISISRYLCMMTCYKFWTYPSYPSLKFRIYPLVIYRKLNSKIV